MSDITVNDVMRKLRDVGNHYKLEVTRVEAQNMADALEKHIAALAAQPQVRKDAEGVDDYTVEGFGEWLATAYSFTGDGHFTRFNMEVAYRAGIERSLASPSAGAVVPEEDIEVTDEMMTAGCHAFSDGKYETTRKETDRVRRIIEAALLAKSHPTTASAATEVSDAKD